MTEFFQYEELTWPEVSELPRDTPLVIPLGEGYPLDQLAEGLGNPPSAGLLPSFPFGWEGSGIRVSEELLGAYLINLLDSLRDEGFTRAFALTPRGTDTALGRHDLGLGSARISLPCQVRESQEAGSKNQPDASDRLPPDSERGKGVLIPIGHTEQHGLHLPLSTDTLIIDAISQGVAALAYDQAFSLPVMPYGVSTHRASFAATLNAGGRAFEDFWVGVIDWLAGRGFDRFYFLSGHGGNMSFLTNVVKYSGERHRHIFCATSFLYLSGPKGISALKKYRQSPAGGMGHACELETSLALYLRPDLVHLERAVDEMNFISTPSYSMDWIESGELIANPPWDDDTATGAYGAGSLGTAEKGEVWLEAAIAEKVGHVAEIHEQQARREARRAAGFGLWGRNQ